MAGTQITRSYWSLHATYATLHCTKSLVQIANVEIANDCTAHPLYRQTRSYLDGHHFVKVWSTKTSGGKEYTVLIGATGLRQGD